MVFKHMIIRTVPLAMILVTAAACSTTRSIIPDRRPDYRASSVEDPLEIPPDLTASTIDDALIVPELNPTGSASFSDYATERGSAAQGVGLAEPVLQTPAGVTVERDGNQRWLVVDQSPESVWPRIKTFWASNGLLLKKDDPRIGVMETDWIENRADISDGLIRDLLSKVADFAFSAPTRDKFRVRVDRGPDGTEIYLTHYGLEEVTLGGRGRQALETIWQPRPRDPELEAEMLNRLMVHLGISEQRAAAEMASAGVVSQGPRVRMVDEGANQKGLLIEQSYSRAWGLVGLALDGSNFVVQDQNRSQGLYVVEYRDPLEQQDDRGFLSKLAFWKGNSPPPKGVQYNVRLAGRGSQTLVVVQNSAGQPDDSPTAQLILDKLAEVIR
jgi:outer membrane protein assembly factor BamC